MFQLSQKTRDLLALFTDAEYGTKFSYDEISDRTGCDAAGADRQRVYSVVRILEREHQRTLLNVRGWGYQIAEPGQHAKAMDFRRRRAGRQVQLAIRTGQATPIARLNEEELRAFSTMQAAVSRVWQAVEHHDNRLRRIERHLGLNQDPPVDGSATEE